MPGSGGKEAQKCEAETWRTPRFIVCLWPRVSGGSLALPRINLPILFFLAHTDSLYSEASLVQKDKTLKRMLAQRKDISQKWVVLLPRNKITFSLNLPTCIYYENIIYF